MPHSARSIRSPRTLLIPAEHQVRELDAKLLIACVAAERGLEPVLGYRTELDFRIASFPPSLYLAKSMTRRAVKMFRIMRKLGHEIMGWDEEALVVLSVEHFHRRKLDATALGLVSLFFAWGEDNADLFRRFPGFPDRPIHVTGNPRADLLRPELRSVYADDAARVRARYGELVLVNTNFHMVNGFLASTNLVQPPAEPGGPPGVGASGVGLTPEFAAGYAAHKGALFNRFQGLLAYLADAFPGQPIVLRPHPTESREAWQIAAKQHPNVTVVHEGVVIPWLLAAKALVHNGCTTAVEAHALGVPAIAFRPVRHPPYDFDLPNGLSHEADDEAGVVALVRRALAGELPPAAPHDLPRPFSEYVAGLEGRLVSDRIVDVIEAWLAAAPAREHPDLGERLHGRWLATRRAWKKRYIKARRPDHRSHVAFQRHRFPGVTAQALSARIERFEGALGRFSGIRARALADGIFAIGR
jgi:surface carbohydrate biosynthesis protein